MRPYYISKINFQLCIADIRMNDVPLYKGSSEGQIAVNYPSNQCILESGIQTISVNIKPLYGQLSLSEDSHCYVEVWLCNVDSLKIEFVKKVSDISFDVNGEGEFPITYKKSTFEAEVPYVITRWSDCISLKEIDSLFSSVKTYYDNIGKMVQKRDFTIYNSILTEREREVGVALYLTQSQVEERIFSLQKYLTNEYEYVQIKNDCFLHFYAAGKAVSLLMADMSSALKFVNKSTGTSINVNVMLGYKRGFTHFVIV